MEHLVRFRTTEGRDGQHTAASLDDALRFVERLRNREEASDVRVYRMQEVPIEFRTYYKVELKPSADSQAQDDAEPAAPDEAAAPPLVAAATGDGEHAEAGGRRLFSR